MGNPRHLLGLSAELAVADWLTDAGWRVVARRARSPDGGEVDIVAIDPRATLVAVEVRARNSSRTGAAAVSVDARRVARLGRTLASIGAGLGMHHAGLRVDLVTVEPDADGGPGRWRLSRLPGIG